MAGSTLFPTAIDDDTTFSDDRVTNDPVRSDEHDNMVAAIRAAQTAIGKTPSPAAGSLRYLLLHGTIANELLVPNSENATLAANTPNLAIASTTACLRLTATGSTRNLTGILPSGGQRAGQVLIVRNVGATISIILKNDDATSTPANRFLFGGDLTLGPKQAVMIQYDATDARWDLASGSGTGGGGGSSTVLVFRGTFDIGTAYVVNDVVLYDTGLSVSSYVAVAGSTGSTPPSANWQLLAQGGQNGFDGVDGQQGPPGIGLVGPPGPSQETVLVANVSGAQTVDLADGSYRVWTLTGTTTISLTDSSGASASSCTFRLYQGGSGANLVNWPGYIHWVGNGGSPPALSAVVGELNEVVVEQVMGVWLGFIPGAGENITPPPDTFAPLDMELFISEVNSANQVGSINYTLGVPTQIGVKRGVIACVVTTRDDNADPPIPGLVGGGATSWTFLISQVIGVATTRRRVTLFGCYDTNNAAAAPYTVSLNAAGASHTGAMVQVVRTKGLVENTWLALALSTVRSRQSTDGGESGTIPKVTLSAPQDATDRSLAFVVDTSSAVVTYTPDSGLLLVPPFTPGGPTSSELDMTSPTIRCRPIWNDTAFDTSPSGVFSASSVWAMVAVEMEQGGVFTPPPPGTPLIDLELMLAGFDTTDQTANYVTSAAGFAASVGSGTSLLIGDNRMGIVDVINTTGTSVDPVQPTLSGGGMTTWDVAGTRVFGASTNRSRITRFMGWQATAGAAAPLTVGVTAQATTGIHIQAWRTPTTDATRFALAKSTTKVRYYLDTSEVAAGPATLANDQLAAPAAGSRVFATAVWNSSLATLGTITPETGLVNIASTAMGSAPARQMYAMLSPASAYDRTPSCTWSSGTALNWVIIASELGQAP